MDQVESLLSRPKFYYNIDGLVELGGGFMCLGSALLWWLLMRSPADSAWHQISLFAFVGLMLLIRYGTKAIKTRITYPRTGFVEYQRRWHSPVIAAALGALVTASLYVVFRRQWDISMLASLTGLVFAAAYGYGIARAVRWKWVIAGAIAVASFVIASLPSDVLGALASDSSVGHPGRAKLDGSIFLCLIAYGTMLLISGGISFWFYLRHTQAPAQDAQ
jgi:hypothetical protein